MPLPSSRPFLVFSIVSLAASAVAAPRYAVQDLGAGPIGTTPGSVAFAVGGSGQVAGWMYDDAGAHAFVSAPGGGLTSLGTLGGAQSTAYGINALGQAVGMSFTAGGYRHAIRYDPGSGIHDLGSLDNDSFIGNYTYATGINDSGTIVGTGDLTSGPERAFVYHEGVGMVALGTLGGNPYGSSYGTGINASGQIVGMSNDDAQTDRAFLYTEGVGMVDVGDLGGGTSYGLAIDDAGDVVGGSATGSGARHAFLRTTDGTMLDLNGGLPGFGDSEARGISNGLIVGNVYRPTQQSGFLYTAAGGMVDLNDLLDPAAAGWTITAANGVNAQGQIAAIATSSLYGQRAVLLSPVPEPASLAGLAAGLFALSRRRRKA